MFLNESMKFFLIIHVGLDNMKMIVLESCWKLQPHTGHTGIRKAILEAVGGKESGGPNLDCDFRKGDGQGRESHQAD